LREELFIKTVRVALTAIEELTTHTGTSEGTLVEREVDDLDFFRSSG
jgi:hypothetical protein